MSTEQIWNDFSARLENFIATKVANRELAKDLLQEVFVKIHLKSAQLENNDKLTSWLYTITRNTITDYYRKKKLPIDSNQELAFLNASEENEADVISFNKCLEPIVNNLPEKYKRALIKTSFENQSQKDFAVAEKLSYTAAKSRVQRARAMVKDLVVECCHPVSDVYGNIISRDEECQNDCGCD